MKVEKENIHRNLDEQHYGMIPTMLLCDCVAPYIVMPFDGPANCGVSGCINPLLSIKLGERGPQSAAQQLVKMLP